MASFKHEIGYRRTDGTYNVRIRVTHNREVRRISTNIFVIDEDLDKNQKIKDQETLDQCEDMLRQCRKACNSFGFSMATLSIDELVNKVKNYLLGGDRFRLDFMEYTHRKMQEMSPGNAATYKTMLSALKRFTNSDSIDISDITSDFLYKFEKFLEKEPSQIGNNRKRKQAVVVPKTGRAISAYTGCIRTIYKKAMNEYNDEEKGILNIRYSPFNKYKVKPQPKTRKRALTPQQIQAIIDIPYENKNISRFNIAKDCFILSFALIGMNSVDMYSAKAPDKNIIIYNRQKTKTRRYYDKAEMRVYIEDCIALLMDKYKDPQGEYLFGFCRHYSSPFTFNDSINTGLKMIGEKIGVDDLEFYAARHSWATIARSATVGIDKATVHEALNHVDSEMKVTDIYIEKDWQVIWNANKKVLDLFDWSAIGYDLL